MQRSVLHGFSFPHHGVHTAFHGMAAAMRPHVRVIDVTPPKWPWIGAGLRDRINRRWLIGGEWVLLPFFRSTRRRVIHHYFSENTLRRSGAWKGPHALVATCHQPPEYMERMRGIEAYRPFFDSLRVCDTVVVQTRCHMPAMQTFLPGMRLEYVPLGVDVEFFSPGTGTAPASGPRILTVGNWMRDYNTWAGAVNLALTADPTLRFRVVANPETLARARTALGGDRPEVEFLHGLSNERLRDLYRESTVMFLPLADAMANDAILEAMAVGLPIVATDLEPVRDYLGDTAGALVPAANSRAAADAILRLSGDAVARGAAGSAARALAVKRYAFPAVAEAYCAIYRSLL